MALTVKQKEMMDALFEGISEEEALDKCNLTKGLFVQWSSSPNWIRAFDERLESLKRQTQTIIAAYQPVAAIKLIALTDSEKEETARHACLDVIKLGTGVSLENEDDLEPDQLQGMSKTKIKQIREILASNENAN